jgi:hypothetical protein
MTLMVCNDTNGQETRDENHVERTAVAASEGHLLAVELEDEAGVGIWVGLESTRSGQESTVGGLDAVLATLEEHHGDGGIIAPRNVLLGVETVVSKVHVALTVDVAKVNLWVHGQLDDPETVLSNDLGVGIELLACTTGIVAVSAQQSPATIGLHLNLELLVGTLGLSVTVEGTSGSGGEVAAQCAADVDLVRGWVSLQEPDLLALQGRSVAVDAETKGLGSQVLAGAVDETEAPSEIARHDTDNSTLQYPRHCQHTQHIRHA